MNKKITVDLLSPSSIEKAIKEINEFKLELINKTELFTKRMAEYGVDFAKYNIQYYDAIDSGALENSIIAKAGDVFFNYKDGNFTFLVYVDSPYGGYVEFGTGIRGGLFGEHPTADEHGWKYDVNNHGDSGWVYEKNGNYYWTDGMESRPFMYATFIDLTKENIIKKVAKEVFGNA